MFGGPLMGPGVGLGMAPMGPMGIGPLGGLMIMMQMMQMMQLLMMMMGQQQGGCGCGGGYPNAGMGMGDMLGLGMGGPPVGGMPFWGSPPGAVPPSFGGYNPGAGGPPPNFGPQQADPSAQIPSFGPNPSKAQINQMIEAACRKYGVPPEIAKAVAYQESGWNPRARSFDGGHGKGIMQIDDRSHQFARGPQVWDPAANIDYGVRLLATNYRRSGGNWRDAVRRYNGSGPMAQRYADRVMSLSQQRPWQRFGVA